MEPFPNQEGSVSRLTTLTTVMHAGLPKSFSSSGYKSQKKNQTQGGGESRQRGDSTEEKTGGEKTRKTEEKEREQKEKKTRQRGKA
jgi:hypothetical protein